MTHEHESEQEEQARAYKDVIGSLGCVALALGAMGLLIVGVALMLAVLA